MGAAPNSGWSGPQSDPVAPPSTAMAAVSHLGFLVLGPLLPLGLYLLTDRSDRFSRDHEREALNFQLTLMIPVMLSLVAFVAAIVVAIPEETSGTDTSDGGSGVVFATVLAIWFATGLIWLAGVVLSIIGAVKAGSGRPWRYPVNIRFVKPR